MKKSIDKMVKEICKLEGKKKPTHAGNIREILAIVADLAYRDIYFGLSLLEWGKRRAKNK